MTHYRLLLHLCHSRGQGEPQVGTADLIHVLASQSNSYED